ncbi:sporulation integral membrane protein YlbJ [Metabacillus idriensis]|uniref:sporulation integral membrane protein YlbJ n=2 Tax=Bacillaceae TaxID=186817 RepID=UPI000C75CD57|nr:MULTISPECIES: sporulation integral membrane protein YlbJ [Bacillaceae]PLR69633.1 sporulation integral membrane protein YlbJ [Bacillus sp. UMB0893]QNG58896.1 sporulation integral membrane protein YlbJ [Bacillus sp. PAMC26568]
MNAAKLKTILLGILMVILAFAMIVNPKVSFAASKTGLDLWWGVVFPSLLPFFILSHLLIGFGIVRFIGVLLEPVMRPIFKVPGVGGFVWAMGWASGSPAGAKLTAEMRKKNQLTALEAERLVSFTNSSNPLFIFGAVAIGFFHDQALGLLLAAAHYSANLAVGLTMRFYGKDETNQNTITYRMPSIREAFRQMHQTRLDDSRPIGKMLGDAVLSSIQTLLMVGGFIILFSVFNKLLSLLYITDYFASCLALLLAAFHLSAELSPPLVSGLFEMTLGSQLTSAADADLIQKAIITSFLLGFSGLSIQAQVASIIAETDIRFLPFFIARVLQGVYAACFAWILWKPLYLELDRSDVTVLPVFLIQDTPAWFAMLWNLLTQIGPILTIVSLLIYIMIYCRRFIFK